MQSNDGVLKTDGATPQPASDVVDQSSATKDSHVEVILPEISEIEGGATAASEADAAAQPEPSIVVEAIANPDQAVEQVADSNALQSEPIVSENVAVEPSAPEVVQPNDVMLAEAEQAQDAQNEPIADDQQLQESEAYAVQPNVVSDASLAFSVGTPHGSVRSAKDKTVSASGTPAGSVKTPKSKEPAKAGWLAGLFKSKDAEDADPEAVQEAAPDNNEPAASEAPLQTADFESQQEESLAQTDIVSTAAPAVSEALSASTTAPSQRSLAPASSALSVEEIVMKLLNKKPSGSGAQTPLESWIPGSEPAPEALLAPKQQVRVKRALERTQARLKREKSISMMSGANTQLLEWCKTRVNSYPNVHVEDFTSDSFGDGIAFAALIHAYNPALIDVAQLDPLNPRENLERAFDIATERLNIPRKYLRLRMSVCRCSGT